MNTWANAPLQFTPINVDFDCGLKNPWVGIPLLVGVIAFAALLLMAVRAELPPRHQIFRLIVALALGWPLCLLISAIPFVAFTRYSFRGQAETPQIGCIGSPPLYLLPASAILLALLGRTIIGLWRLAHSSHQDRL